MSAWRATEYERTFPGRYHALIKKRIGRGWRVSVISLSDDDAPGATSKASGPLAAMKRAAAMARRMSAADSRKAEPSK